MAVDFFFDPPTFSIPTLQSLRTEWQNIPNDNVRNAVAREEQYLLFHRFILDSTHSTKIGWMKNPPYKKRLDLTVRAGAVKAALLLCASISEAVLRAHAEARRYGFHKKKNERTFGVVLNAWKEKGKPREDIDSLWSNLNMLRDERNNIHLFKAAKSKDFKEILKQEEQMLEKAYDVIKELKKLITP